MSAAFVMHRINLDRTDLDIILHSGGRFPKRLLKLLNHPAKSICIMLVAGAATAVALPPWYILPILPLGLGIFFASCFFTHRLKLLIWQAFAFGMGYHCFGLYWITYAILTRIAEFWWLVPFAVPFISLLVAPLLIIPAVGTRLLVCMAVERGSLKDRRGIFIAGAVAIFAGLYVIADQMRMYIFTGFPWNPLGSVWEFPNSVGDFFIQPAAYVGVDGLSLVTVLIGVGFLFRGLPRLSACFLVWTWVFFAWVHMNRSSFVEPPEQGLPRIGIIQTDIPETDILTDENERERFSKDLNWTRELSNEMNAFPKKGEGAHIVIWPESSVRFPLNENPLAQQLMAEAAGGAWVVVGTERAGEGGWYNSVQAVSPEGRVEFFYDKVRLVPFGEYQPGFIPVNLLPGQFKPGAGHKIWSAAGFDKPSPLVCYETIFSGDVKPHGQRAGWLFSVSNDAWYAHSSGPFQHIQSVRMRAVEEGLPAVFVNNAGPSGAYDAHGKNILYIKSGLTQTAVIDVPAALKPTLFSVWGRKIPTLLSFVSIITGFGLMALTKRFKNND